MVRPSRRTKKLGRRYLTPRNPPQTRAVVANDAVKAAERVAMAAFGSGLRLAAAIGTVAAKTTGFALASLATGADKFSELVKKEALPPKGRSVSSGRTHSSRGKRKQSVRARRR